MKAAAGVLAVAVILLAGCSSVATPAAKPTPKALRAVGVVTAPMDYMDLMTGKYKNAQGAPCASGADYSDIKAGAQVVVTDASSKTIGIGTLGDGVLQPGPKATAFDALCAFAFDVPGISAGSKFYGIHAGSPGRDVVQVPAAGISNVKVTIGP